MTTTETSTRDTLERFFAAEAAYVEAGGPGRASFEEIADCLDPEVTLHQAPGLPYAGTWRGPSGIERFLSVMGDAWQVMEFLDQHCFVNGPDVVVTNRVRFVARTTGRELDTRIVQEMTVRDGRLVEIRPFYWDPAAVADALT
ncbi:nuclear transport factor 2 family protein [Streptomyces sp. NPDC088785]|uniref:nuclear transport factor 2 family protein n=1 Tax=Streptomyces sp. NPDC088785 TaxID=3365897 RepID=UPI0038164203